MSMQRSLSDSPLTRPQSESLADLLERVLDKGVVVAGDIVVNLLDIELLTLKVRLLVCSADTAQQMGIDWWKHDPFLTGRHDTKGEGSDGKEGGEQRERALPLKERVERLEQELSQRETRDAG